MIIGRSKREICYHGRCGHPVIHEDETSGKRYIMVRKKGGGTKRLYLRGATKYYDPEEGSELMEEEVYAPRRRNRTPAIAGTKLGIKHRIRDLKKMWVTLETLGKALRRKGEPRFVYQPLFKAQNDIEKCIRSLTEAYGALTNV